MIEARLMPHCALDEGAQGRLCAISTALRGLSALTDGGDVERGKDITEATRAELAAVFSVFAEAIEREAAALPFVPAGR